MTNKRNLPVLTDEEMAEKIRKSIENGERRVKVGDRVQYCGYGAWGAKGVIIREKEKTLYYSKWERQGEDQYCLCYLVRYDLSDGRTVENVARPQDLILLENEE